MFICDHYYIYILFLTIFIKFVKDVYDGCLYEYDVIMKVFPSPTSVIQRLVQRVIEQRVCNWLTYYYIIILII